MKKMVMIGILAGMIAGSGCGIEAGSDETPAVAQQQALETCPAVHRFTPMPNCQESLGELICSLAYDPDNPATTGVCSDASCDWNSPACGHAMGTSFYGCEGTGNNMFICNCVCDD